MTPAELQAFIRPLRFPDYPEIEVVFDAGRTPGYVGGYGTHQGRLLDVVKLSFTPGYWGVEIQTDPWATATFTIKEDWDCIRLCSLPVQATAHPAGTCPKCGDKGEWRMLALFCTKGHGRFAG